MTTASSTQRRDHVSTRLDPAIMQEVEALATAERRPISAVVRIAVEDWLAARRAGQQRERAA